MSWNSRGTHEWDHQAVEWDAPVTTPGPCLALEEEVEALREQIALLEEGLLLAPGMERAALFKEIAEFHERLDSKRRALRRCRDAGAAEQPSE